MSGVAIFLGQGKAQVAGQSYGIVPAGQDGAVRLQPHGPVLRPLRFGERVGLARAALAAPSPEDELADAVLTLATLEDGPHPAAAAIALHLAGAGSADIGFAAAQSVLARQLGWTQADVSAALAVEIDALASDWQKSLRTGPSGWTKFVFAGPQSDEGSDPQAVAYALARDLLQRMAKGIDPEDLPVVPGDLSRTIPTEALDASFGDAIRADEAAPGQVDAISRPMRQERDIAVRNGVITVHDDQAQRRVRRSEDEDHSPKRSSMPRKDHTVISRERPFGRPGAQASDPLTYRERTEQPLAPQVWNADQAVIAREPLPRQAQTPAAPDIWAARPTPPRMSFTARRSAPVVASHAASVPAFAGWFDAAPATSVLLPGAAAPAAWVWDRADARAAPIPQLPDMQMIEDDPGDALAEALHLAADLRGIAP